MIHFQTEAWKKQYLSVEGEKVTIAKRGFDSFQQSAHLLWRCIREYGFNFEQTREVIHGLNGQSGKQFLTPSHKMVIYREYIIITPHVDFLNDIIMKEGQELASLGSWEMNIEKLVISRTKIHLKRNWMQ